MKIKKLLKDIAIQDVKGSKEMQITGISANSKLVSPGNLFVAKKGRKVDAGVFIPEAIEAGAQAILTDFYDPTLKNVTQIIHPDVASIEPLIAAQYYQHPSEQLLMAGITGTNGKTTTAYLVQHLLKALRGPCGLIGTIEYQIGNSAYQASHTTPDICTNQKLLREMVAAGCRSAVMEVTSHALDQGRVSGIAFDVAIFTNLTAEHLDYHGTMQAYGEAKRKLFCSLAASSEKKKPYASCAVVNGDDPAFQDMVKGCQAKVFTYGQSPAVDLRAKDLVLGCHGTSFTLCYEGAQWHADIPLVGRHNVYNCLAAISCCLVQGFSLDRIWEALHGFPPVQGRMEPVENDAGLSVFVDFAHTPDALDHALHCLQEITKKRIITVFGCGGDRDRQKRPLMAKVAEKYSSLSVITSDNPRTEEPHAIIEEIVRGFHPDSPYVIEPDRKKAIERAIFSAKPEDVVLIAGRGHETSQLFSHYSLEFDDRKVARAALEQCRVS